MKETWIADQLVEHGIQLFKAPKEEFVRFTDDKKADSLMNDFENHPDSQNSEEPYILVIV